jgi:hypothetical protein
LKVETVAMSVTKKKQNISKKIFGKISKNI